MGMKGDAEWWREKGKQVAAELRIFADFLEHQRLPTDTCGAPMGKYTIMQNGVSVTVDYDNVLTASERLLAGSYHVYHNDHGVVVWADGEPKEGEA